MFYAHAQKQTNKHNSLSFSLSRLLSCHIWAFSASLWTISFSSFYRIHKEQLLWLLWLLFSLYLSLKTTQFLILHFLFDITALPPPSVCLSLDAQTLWPPRRWSFERVSSWWWGQFRPWRCSSSGGSRRSSCPYLLALGAGWPSCR